ncbi:MAG: sigma 54-interacting transcriptional regulator [Bacteroidia bacterium]|nr:sigma 54-interacting transcriptional regulator [Bacteroidia bacterium]
MIKTLSELKKSGWKSRSVKEEMRENLVKLLKNGEPLFTAIKGYDDTVIPQLQTAILSRHNFILLGLRGQAKTRIARLCVELLDEYMPVIEGSEINDDPYKPLSKFGKDILEEKGENTPIAWVHRSERFTEKLATPDVSVADLIGDADPIKAANMKLAYSDERVIHYGLIPRAHRGIFVINELPDLQARIQVSLFNILQEGDIQIRGFKVRLPLDIQFIFTANPEDYTNRGSIVTPLKDRIDSQILTHYPKTIELGKEITLQESEISDDQRNNITVSDLLLTMIEKIAFEARESDLVDKKSGVSARLTIAALENLYSTAERRMLMNGESNTSARITDIFGTIQAITGKIELVYEGELEGVNNVAGTLIGKALRSLFTTYFPDPMKLKKSKKPNPYISVVTWFNDGNMADLSGSATNKVYEKTLNSIQGLEKLIKDLKPDVKGNEKLLLMEFLLFGLVEYSQLSKHASGSGFKINDTLSGMLNAGSDEDSGGYYESAEG